ncbi:MAG: hypothetical protein Q8S31_08775 [Alphaproteobacteria bacterium]|nr:hypothetical protein [Alphaproteobacteria bacterium]
MLKKAVKNFLFVLLVLNATFSDALLPDYEYTENTPLYLKVYIDELAEKQIEGGVKTEETINEFRKEKEGKYLPLLAKIKKNKNKTQINFEFDKKFPKQNKGALLNLVAILLEAEELNQDGVNDFIRPRHDRIVNYRKTECKQSQKKYQQSDAYKESQKKYYQNNKERIGESQKKYRQRKKLLAQQGDPNVQQELLNKIQLFSDAKIQALIDASLEPNTPRLFDVPTPKTPSVAQYLLDLYQNGKSNVFFDEAIEDAIYEDNEEYQDEILQEDMTLSENIMFGKRKEIGCENSSSDDDNAPKRSKLDD